MENNLGQVTLVRDINPGSSDYGYYDNGSYPYNLTELNGKVYFTADDGENGNELWVSDGTTEGTQLLADINPGSTYGYPNRSNARNLTEFNGKLYFTANDGENGNELWVTDGTTEGTQLLADINPGISNYGYAYSSYAYNLMEFNGKLYFTANDRENGRELWLTDGTADGTQLLADINPGSSDYGYDGYYGNGSYPRDFTESNDKLYFTANDGETGRELWVTDGTAEGTQLLADINPGSSNYGYNYSYPNNLTEFNDKLYFTANGGENGNELWVTDGTAEGTQLLLDIRPGIGNYGYAYSSYVDNLTEFNGKLYFTADDGENGNELWVSDGTTEGTQLLADINPGNSGSSADNFTEFNGKLYFTANDGENGNELWVTDGTTDGTQLVSDINPESSNYGYNYGSYADNLTEFNGKLYFTANDGENGDELWVTDGTTDGTQLVSDINPNFRDNSYPYSSRARNLTEFNGKLYFSANDGENGNELWVSDGTADGSQLLVDINLGDGYYGNSSYPNNFTEFDDKLYFTANDGETGSELWISDGTAEGTQLLVDIRLGSSNYGYNYSSYPDNLTEFNDKLYFTANDGENGLELWVSDGTAEGTQLLVDIRSGVSNYGYAYSSSPRNLTEFNDKLYFTANDGENGRELWVSDGTAEGTQLLVDINPGGNDGYYGYYGNGSYPNSLTEFNDKLYFSANDGENGSELWVSDGTAEGTQLLVDINPGNSDFGYYYNGSNPYNLIEFNDKLYFSANDGENGRELWVSDGTAEGTQLLVDINPGISNYGYPNSSNPYNFIEFNDKLYFTANDGENGNELWVSDGTAEGTQLLVDINPGSSNYGYNYGSYISDFVEFNDQLYFTANDGENGREIWTTDGTTEGTQLVVDIRPGIDVNISPYSSNADSLTVIGDELFFSADNGESGRELFKLNVDDPINVINGNNRANNLVGTDGADEINGLKGKDTLNGGAGNDTLNGGDGRDTLNGGADNDVLLGENGRDILNGDDGFDSLVGGVGRDTLNGGSGDDTLLGGERQDSLTGGTGDDLLFGDGSKDTLDGGAGDDTLTGGDRADTFILRLGEGEDTILDFQVRKDSIGLSGGLEFTDLTLSGNTIQAGGELLATLDGVNTENLTSDSFITI